MKAETGCRSRIAIRQRVSVAPHTDDAGAHLRDIFCFFSRRPLTICSFSFFICFSFAGSLQRVCVYMCVSLLVKACQPQGSRLFENLRGYGEVSWCRSWSHP